jgi:hypothetical protein
MMLIRKLIIGRSLALGKGVLLIALYFSMIGCESSEDPTADIKLEWEITPTPPSVGQGTLNITLKDSTGQLLTGADVNIEGNMSHPGMQPILAEAEETETGVYSASIEFTMGGDWFFIIESTLPDDRVLERQINIAGVSSE